MQKPPSTFIDPYAGRHDGRMSFDVVRSEWAFFTYLDNTPRAREIMLSIVLHRIKQELIKHGITEHNPTAFKSAIGGLTITLGDVTGLLGGAVADRQPQESNSGHERSGTGTVPLLPPPTPPQPTSPQSPPSRPSETGGGKRKTGKGKSKIG